MRLEDKLDLQYLGGRYDTVSKLLNAHPDLKTRWTFDELTKLYDLLGELELVGFRCSKGAKLLEEYLDLRGDEGDLMYCVEYNTSEYCVVLKLWNSELNRMKAQQLRLMTKMRREGYDFDDGMFAGLL